MEIDKQTTTTETPAAFESRKLIHTMQEWLSLDLSADATEPVIGSPNNQIVRPRTKNFIEAPEKCFKTTFALRLAAGLSCGETVFPALPIPRAQSVLYLHGELSDAEIRERTIAASKELAGPFDRLFQGRAPRVHLVYKPGQEELRELITTYTPEHLILDPWQSFITGCDENSYKDMSTATEFCNLLIEEFGVTIWLPIHLGKDHKRGARGHSVLAGWRDTRIQLTRDAKTDLCTVEVEPRWAPRVKPFNLKFENQTVWPTDESAEKGQAFQIRDYVRSNGAVVPKQELVTFLGIKAESANRAIKRAEKAGVVIVRGDYVCLPEANLLESESEEVV